MGRDIVDHGVGGMDDLCNAASLALRACAKPSVVTTGVSIHICSSGPRSIPGSDIFSGASGRVWERTIERVGRIRWQRVIENTAAFKPA